MISLRILPAEQRILDAPKISGYVVNEKFREANNPVLHILVYLMALISQAFGAKVETFDERRRLVEVKSQFTKILEPISKGNHKAVLSALSDYLIVHLGLKMDEEEDGASAALLEKGRQEVADKMGEMANRTDVLANLLFAHVIREKAGKTFALPKIEAQGRMAILLTEIGDNPQAAAKKGSDPKSMALAHILQTEGKAGDLFAVEPFDLDKAFQGFLVEAYAKSDLAKVMDKSRLALQKNPEALADLAIEFKGAWDAFQKEMGEQRGAIESLQTPAVVEAWDRVLGELNPIGNLREDLENLAPKLGHRAVQSEIQAMREKRGIEGLKPQFSMSAGLPLMQMEVATEIAKADQLDGFEKKIEALGEKIEELSSLHWVILKQMESKEVTIDAMQKALESADLSNWQGLEKKGLILGKVKLKTEKERLLALDALQEKELEALDQLKSSVPADALHLDALRAGLGSLRKMVAVRRTWLSHDQKATDRALELDAAQTFLQSLRAIN